MDKKVFEPFGRYVPVVSTGQVRFYLPLENCTNVGELKASGFEVPEESQNLVKIMGLIKEAEAQRAKSEEKKRRFITRSLEDFSREAGTIALICPCCLGRINRNAPSHEGKVLCGWYDQLSEKCDGHALYSIDRASLVLGLAEVEIYICPEKGTQLDLAVYDFRYLKEELERRSRMISRSAGCGRSSASDVELAKALPLRISMERTRGSFKELVLDFMARDAINWLNTLSQQELGSFLDRAATLYGL